MPAPEIPILDVTKEDASSQTSALILKRLAEAEQEIDAIYEGISFGSYCIGPDGNYTSINALELSWLGYSREELIGKKSPREFLTSASQLKLDHYLELHGRYGFSGLELDLVDSREQQRPILMSFNGTLSEDGRPHKSRFVSFDMTAIYLGRNLQRIAAISFESMCGMYVTDTSATIIRVNAGFTTLTGYSNQEVVGQNMLFMSSAIHEPQFYDTMWQSIRSTGYWQGEIRYQRKDGVLITAWASLAAVKDADGIVSNYVGSFYDITASKASQDEVTRMAFHDTLTQLPNRRFLQQRIEHVLELEGRNGLHSALLFVDLDHFKWINDTLGHEAGDWVLIQAAQRMKAALRDGDTVARVGGDEFAILLEGLGTEAADAANQARLIGDKLLATLAVPYPIQKTECICTASIGISMVNANESATELLNHADLAMYQAKKHGRNALEFFDPVMQLASTVRAELEEDLRRAVAADEFELHYQPQVDAQARVTGVEALLRWRHPTRGWVSPLEIIPLAEQCGLMVPIGNWVLQTACRQMKLWQQHASTAKLSIAVNISAVQFQRVDFVNTVLQALEDSHVDPAQLNIEVTEKMLNETASATSKMRTLGAVGVRFSIDDFGTGCSSIGSLTQLPISTLKIDPSFVQRMAASQTDRSIVQTIVVMAQSLGIGVIAEGVETHQQREQLNSLGCEHYQGYLFGRPVAAPALTQTLECAYTIRS